MMLEFCGIRLDLTQRHTSFENGHDPKRLEMLIAINSMDVCIGSANDEVDT